MEPDERGSVDGYADAVPGLAPDSLPPSAVVIDVDGEKFALRHDEFGGTGYTWLSGPNPGYGFGASPTSGWTVDQHVECIRGFLAQIDPSTGYLEDE